MYSCYNLSRVGDIMKEIIIETFIDSIKLIPFLFIAFLIIELIEHKFSKKQIKLIEKSGKFGPIFGALLGMFPQCGFSVLATNFYITRIISLGTLIAIYLSTSDEMLPILLSRNVEIGLILKILSIKFLVGVLFGFIIDIFCNSNKEKQNYLICKEDNCHCEHGILKSVLKHTFNILLFVLIINFILTTCFEYLGSDYISKIFFKDSLFGPFISSLVGLIPNCGASVMITELYLNSAITFGSLISGLLTGSGVAIVVLMKSNKNIKENMKIVLMLYLIGVLTGIIVDIL